LYGYFKRNTLAKGDIGSNFKDKKQLLLRFFCIAKEVQQVLFRRIIRTKIYADGKTVLGAVISAYFMAHIRFKKDEVTCPGFNFDFFCVPVPVIVDDQVA